MTDAAEDRIALLKGLRAVRTFRQDPIPQEIVDDTLEVARWTGSAMNLQPWEILVVRDRSTLEALAEVEGYAGHLAGAAVGVVLIMAGDRAEQEAFDEGRLAERIMLSAAAYGVGSSIGWFSGGGREAARDLLGVPAERTVRTAISLGYPDEAARRSRGGPARKPLSEITHEERYG